MQAKTPNADVMAHAERWYARLMAPDCTAAERLEFQRWRSVPEHAAACERTERLWHSLGKLAGRADLEQLSQKILTETTRRPRPWSRLAIAASVLIPLA